MEADFSGYATKVGLKCSDGRTIMPDAFKHQHQMQVPLVWQHGHKDPKNVLGHVVLENRDDGVYCQAFFNNTPEAQHAKTLVEHKDINALSIWANQLIERSKKVLHGAIREVSLVLSGANPGALIDNITIHHSDGEDETLEDEVIIYTGLELQHSDEGEDEVADDDKDESVEHASDASEAGETVKDVYDSMDKKQQDVLHFMVGEAIASASTKGDMKQDSTGSADDGDDTKGNEMGRNVFEKDEEGTKERHYLGHAEVQGIVADAIKGGSLRDAVEGYCLSHGIEDIDQLFPDAQAISEVPEFIQRRTEWVTKLWGGLRKSPFSRIKTLSADITEDEARAKGYITGSLKKEEFFGVAKRVTTPTTVYKKQKLDRDDVVDITDFDVVAWLKTEMRLMLDEELARAVLVGDGRDVSHEDKINEQNIRPISEDHELFTTTINVNLGDASSGVQEIVDAIVMNRRYYKGTGLPTMFISETYIGQFLLLKDTLGRRIYKDLGELASELRVAEIVPVEILEEYDDIVCVLVNPADYVVGANKGGQISLFDDFDIDYNQYKYLIETRCCGALVKLKSAMVVKAVAADLVLVVPAEPAFDAEEGEVTITNQTGVVYKDGAGTTINAAGSPYTVTPGTPYVVNATPDTGYYFGTSEEDSWTYNAEA